MSDWGTAALMSLCATGVWAAVVTYLDVKKRDIRDEQERRKDKGDPTPDPVLNLPLRRVVGNAETVDITSSMEREKAERERALVEFVRTVAVLSRSDRITGTWQVETNEEEVGDGSGGAEPKGKGGVFWKKRYTLASVFPEWQRRWLPLGFVLGATDRANEVQYLFSGGISRLVVESDKDLELEEDVENAVLRVVADLHDCHWRNVGQSGAPEKLRVVVNQSSGRAVTTALVDAEGKSIPMFVSTFSFRLMREPVSFGTDVWSLMCGAKALFLGWNGGRVSDGREMEETEMEDRGLAGEGEQGVVFTENRGAHLTFLFRSLPVAFPLDAGSRFVMETNLPVPSNSSGGNKDKVVPGVFEQVVRAEEGFGLPLAVRLKDEAQWVLEMRMTTRGRMREPGDLFWDASSVLSLAFRTGSFDLTWDPAGGGWQVESLDGEARVLGEFGTVDLAVYSGVPLVPWSKDEVFASAVGPVQVPLRGLWQSRPFSLPLPVLAEGKSGKGSKRSIFFGERAQSLSLVRYTETHGKVPFLDVDSLVVPLSDSKLDSDSLGSGTKGTDESGPGLGLGLGLILGPEVFGGVGLEQDAKEKEKEKEKAKQLVAGATKLGSGVFAALLCLVLLGFTVNLSTAVSWFCSFASLAGVVFGGYLLFLGLQAIVNGSLGLDWLKGKQKWIVWGCLALGVTSLVLSAAGLRTLGSVSPAFVVSVLLLGEAMTVLQVMGLTEDEDRNGKGKGKGKEGEEEEEEEDDQLPSWKTVLDYAGGNVEVAEQILETAKEERRLRQEAKADLKQRRTSLVLACFVMVAGLASVALSVELRGMAASPRFPGTCVCPSVSTAGYGLSALLDTLIFMVVWEVVNTTWKSDCDSRDVAARVAVEAAETAEKLDKPASVVDPLQREAERLVGETCESLNIPRTGFGSVWSWFVPVSLVLLMWTLRPWIGSTFSSVGASANVSCELQPGDTGRGLPMLLQFVVGLSALVYVVWTLLGDSDLLVDTQEVQASEKEVGMSCVAARMRAKELRDTGVKGTVTVGAVDWTGIGLQEKAREVETGLWSLGCLPSRDILLRFVVGGFVLMWIFALASSGRRAAPNSIGATVVPLLGYMLSRNAMLFHSSERFRNAGLAALVSV